MTNGTRIALLLASAAVSTIAIGATAAQAETPVTCYADFNLKTMRCGNALIPLSGITNASAFGSNAQASGSGSSAFGANAFAFGASSTALGYSTEADEFGTATGFDAKAASKATAVGAYAFADAVGTVAIGMNSKAYELGTIAIGQSAFGAGEAALAIGDQSYAGSGGTAIGAETEASSGAVALGYGAKAYQDYGLALGASSQANGLWAIAIGDADATDDFTVALGDGAQAGSAGALALGRNAKALHEKSVALGYGALTTAVDQVALGGAGNHVRIGDVASSTAAQDINTLNIATLDANGVIGRSTVSMSDLLAGFGGAAFDPTYLETQLSNHDGRITKTEGAVADHASTLSMIGSGLSALTGLTNDHIAGANAIFTDHGKRLDALEAAGGGMPVDPGSLQSQITSLSGDLKGVQQVNASQDAAIATQQGWNGQMDARVADLETKVANIGSGGAGGMPFDSSGLQSQLDTHNGQIAAIEQKNGEQDQRLAGVETKNAQQDLRLGAVESKNAEQDDRLAAAETKNVEQDTAIAEGQQKNADQDKAIAVVQEENGKQDARLAKAEESVVAHQLKLGNHEDRISTLETLHGSQQAIAADIASMQDSIADHSIAIADLQGQVGTLFDMTDKNRRDIGKANEGVAMALAMESPAVPAGKSFALSGGVGNFRGKSALSMAVSAAVGETMTVSAGVGYSVNTKQVGTRAGFQIAF